jgi:hypothetical protein
MTAQARAAMPVTCQASWKAPITVAGVGVPRTATRTATPITAPSWRDIALTADPTPYCAGGRSWLVAAPRVLNAAPIAMPVKTAAGRKSVR